MGGAEFPTRTGKHSSLKRPGQHSQGPAASPAAPTSDLCVCEVLRVAGGAPSGPDSAAFAEPRGSLVTGVSPCPFNMPGGAHNVRNSDLKK